jgi:hypothetical protein
MSEDTFTDEMIVVSCDKIFECYTQDEIDAAGDYWFFGADSAECQDIFHEAADESSDDTGAEDCENFDSSAAKECLSEYEALTCDDLAEGTSPDACEDVCD